jgi:hypothetical protein
MWSVSGIADLALVGRHPPANQELAMLSPLAVATATVLALANPAASVRYDPETKTGFVGSADVRKVFGWSSRELASNASGLVFGEDFWTDDNYRATCGAKVVPVVHHRDFGRFELIDTVSYKGFRITGARFGISGTSVPPGPGQPCPDGKGPTITRVRLVSSTTGGKLTVASGDRSRTLASW